MLPSFLDNPSPRYSRQTPADLGFGFCCCPSTPRSYYVPKVITPCCPNGLPVKVHATVTLDSGTCTCLVGAECDLIYDPHYGRWWGRLFSSPAFACSWYKYIVWYCKTTPGCNKMVIGIGGTEDVACTGLTQSLDFALARTDSCLQQINAPENGFSCSPLHMEYITDYISGASDCCAYSGSGPRPIPRVTITEAA